MTNFDVFRLCLLCVITTNVITFMAVRYLFPRVTTKEVPKRFVTPGAGIEELDRVLRLKATMEPGYCGMVEVKIQKWTDHYSMDGVNSNSLTGIITLVVEDIEKKAADKVALMLKDIPAAEQPEYRKAAKT